MLVCCLANYKVWKVTEDHSKGGFKVVGSGSYGTVGGSQQRG